MSEEYIEKIQKLLSEMENFFVSLDDNKKQLENDLRIKEAEQDDLLHEFELGKLNAIELMATAKRLVKTRKERREIKDTIDVLKTEKGFADRYITKGICSDLAQAIKNLENLKQTWKTRKYNTKVLSDLKIGNQKGN